LQRTPPFSKEGIWFHACSLGEAKALAPLIETITKAQVNISVITHTGFSAASAYKEATVRYLPYEIFLPFWQKRQRLLIVLEAELWYLLFLVAAQKGTKTVLLNARISERSYPKYMKMRWFYSRLFKYVDHIYVQSEVDKKRFESLGAEHIKVVGNIKLAQKITATQEYKRPDGLNIVGGSTHEGEEKIILDAFLAFKKVHKEDMRLIIVPRHPERFESVAKLMQACADENGLSFSRFSKSTALETDLILVDKMGELNNIYAISDIAVLGGAFAPIGGHNPLEPIAFGCKIISGKKIFNQQELFKYVKYTQLVEDGGLAEAFSKALDMPASNVEETVDLNEINKLIKEYDYE
jgi:3-deoxy-D-manno-octulosonic-acid transferase